MDILVLSLVAGLVVAGGIWMATRESKPADSRPSDLKSGLKSGPPHGMSDDHPEPPKT
jgi:hypothetical protein